MSNLYPPKLAFERGSYFIKVTLPDGFSLKNRPEFEKKSSRIPGLENMTFFMARPGSMVNGYYQVQCSNEYIPYHYMQRMQTFAREIGFEIVGEPNAHAE